MGNRLVRASLMGAGGMLTTIGVIGIFVPLLPTTVFLLAAAACFGKSSPAAHRWLTTNRYFGHYLDDYRQHRASWPTKVVSIGLLWAGILGAVYLLGTPLWLTLVLLAVAAAVTAHLLRLRPARR